MVNISPWIELDEAMKITGVSRQALQYAARPTEYRPPKIRTKKILRTLVYHKADCEDYKPIRSPKRKNGGGPHGAALDKAATE